MPTTTTGIATEFITFSRPGATQGGATVTDSDGLVKWAPHNLLLNSESFDKSSWTKTTTTVAANSIAAPNGTTTADTLTAAGANSTTLQSYTALAVPYTFGVWLRRKTGTGNIQIAADSGTYTTVTITSSWALYTVSQTPAAGTISAGIRIVTSADEVYVWGAALYRSDLAMQPNTSAYTLYNPTTPKNLLGYTESFDNAAWTKSGLAATPVITNTVVAPNGLQTADKIVENSSASTHYLAQSVAVTASPCVVSIYAKAAERSFVSIGFDGLNAWFNLSTGDVGTVESGLTATITPVGNGWYRCAVYRTVALAATKTFAAYIANADNVVSYTGNGTSGIYLWGAQSSDSASLDTYAPVYGAAVTSAAYYGPRRDFNGSTLACNGLLVEQQRTNLLTYSADFAETAAWTPDGATISSNVTATTAPDGTTTSDKLVENSAASGFHRLYRNSFPSISDSTTYTVSAYFKADGRFIFQFLFTDNVSSWAREFNLSSVSSTTVSGITSPTSYDITPVGNSWYRCSITMTSAASGSGGATGVFQVRLCNATGVSDYAGNGTSGVYLWGAQLEATASFSTSYIPTLNTSATRNADVASVSTQAFPYGAASGTLVTNVQTANSTAYVAQFSDGTTSNFIAHRQASSGTALVVTASGSSQANIGTTALTAKIASAFSASDFAVSVNGGAVATQSSGTVPTVNLLSIGSQVTGTAYVNGWIKQITYIPRRLTNAELVARST